MQITSDRREAASSTPIVPIPSMHDQAVPESLIL